MIHKPSPTTKMSSTSLIKIILLLLISTSMINQAQADATKDREECAPQLLGLATCLPYVSNKAKAPTPDCCNGLKQVLNKDKKCLCVIVRDRNDPDVGIEINVTLALGLPSVCHATANVSQCPELLKMDPKSSEAQVFYQLLNNSSSVQNTTTSAISPASAPVNSASPVAQGPTSDGRKLQSLDFGLGLTIFLNFLVCYLSRPFVTRP